LSEIGPKEISKRGSRMTTFKKYVLGGRLVEESISLRKKKGEKRKGRRARVEKKIAANQK